MRITWLPDARHAPRHVAVGEFDGVHLGHREVIRGADTVLTFEPHPRAVVAPHAAPKLLTTLAAKADLVASLGVEELVVIPFDGAFSQQSAQEFIDHVLVDRLGAERSRWGRTSASATRRAATRPSWRPRTRSTPAWSALVEVDGRGRDLHQHPRPRRRRATSARPAGCSARPSGCAARSSTATSAGATSATRPPTSSPTTSSSTRATGSTPAARRCRSTASWRSAPAATSVGVRPTFVTGRGVLVEAYLLDFDGGPLRTRAPPRLPGAPARRAALRLRRRPHGADGARRRGHATYRGLSSHRPWSSAA